MIVRLVGLLFLVTHAFHCYKVVVYSSKFSFSHMNYLGSIADTLQKAGNNVTVIQPVINAEIRGTGCHLSKVITIHEDQATLKAIEPMKDNSIFKRIWSFDTRNPLGVIGNAPSLKTTFDVAMKNVLNRTDVMDQLREEKFDLGIVEMFDYGAFAVMHELGITNLIGVHSTSITDRTSWAIGNPILPSYVPPMQSAAGDDGSFLSRLSNVIFTVFSWNFELIIEDQAQSYLDEHHPDAPKIQETIGNMPFIFTNSEPLLDFPRAKLHKVVDLGGIGLQPAKKLDENWVKVLKQRKINVLISFGSIAPSSQMPGESKETIKKVMKKFPDITFIWKYETPEDGLGAEIPNLYLSKWTPQTDLLASGQIDLFITHGGAGSVLESASSGVPLIVVPLFGDQHRNALMAERFGYATVFKKHSLAVEEELEAVIRKGLEDQDLKAKAQLAKDVLKARPFSPQELLIRHVDLAVKFGNLPHLAPSGRNFWVFQYHNLDVLALLVFMCLGILYAPVFVIRKCFFKANEMLR